MGVKGVPHLSRKSEPEEASRCSKGTGGLAPAVGCDAISGRDRVVDPGASDRPRPSVLGWCRSPMLLLGRHDGGPTRTATAGRRPHGGSRLKQMAGCSADSMPNYCRELGVFRGERT